VNILGTRGVPAAHGGFESFAENLSRWLVEEGHSVTVYCQGPQQPRGRLPRRWQDSWEGVQRVHFATASGGPLGTVEFDMLCAFDVLLRPGLDLVLGYNTALFNLLGSVVNRTVFINMDGVEWRRAKWSGLARAWLYVNELVGANAYLPIADHPEIARHLQPRTWRRVRVIPYGAEQVVDAPVSPVLELGLKPDKYVVSIARIVPENSILEIVHAFSRLDTDFRLAVVGDLDLDSRYHRAISESASPQVVFLGAIYDKSVVRALRFHARAYVHGHTVGGTNPSLVEALGAGSAILAHDNPFNRWTAGSGQLYFKDSPTCTDALRVLLDDPDVVNRARLAARDRHREAFRLQDIHRQYVKVLAQSEVMR
jgi:glycosyltransferase involved in cell wall biosynthesis